MKVYKLTVMIINHDELTEKEITKTLENTHYPNHCINPIVMDICSSEIGEWDDDHPLNTENQKQHFESLFPPST